jgi:hypothetical protein
MAAVLWPLLQRYVAPPVVVSVTEAVAQIIPSLFVLPDVSVTEIDAAGGCRTVIVVVSDEVQPQRSVTVTL